MLVDHECEKVPILGILPSRAKTLFRLAKGRAWEIGNSYIFYLGLIVL